MNVLHERMERAVKSLAKPGPRSTLIENVYWASCEGLLQSLILAGHNATATDVLCARERSLQKGWTPDLVFIDAAHVETWFEGSAAERASITRGVYEAKLVWTRPCASGNATLPRKLQELVRQRQKLLDFSLVRPKVATGLVLALAGGADSDPALEADLHELSTGLEQGLGLRRRRLSKESASLVLGARLTSRGAGRFLEVRVFVVPVG